MRRPAVSGPISPTALPASSARARKPHRFMVATRWAQTSASSPEGESMATISRSSASSSSRPMCSAVLTGATIGDRPVGANPRT